MSVTILVRRVRVVHYVDRSFTRGGRMTHAGNFLLHVAVSAHANIFGVGYLCIESLQHVWKRCINQGC